MEKIKIAKIVNVFGIKGEVKLYNYSDQKERFEELDEVTVSVNGRELILKIERVRYQGNMVILKFKGINDRNQAEALRNAEVYITEADLRELPDDTYYIRDLIGMKVVDLGCYGEIGILKDVLQNTAQDVYVVKTLSGKEVLIPAVKELVKKIDTDEGVIFTELIPGFIDEGLEL